MNFGKYLSEFVYGATDGTITTFAIVSGVLGASLSPALVLVLGLANLFADGFSMAVSDYLSTKSHLDLDKLNQISHGENKKPIAAGAATFVSFVVIGFIPLVSFVMDLLFPELIQNAFLVSTLLTGIAFVVIGATKAKVTNKNIFYSAVETIFIGGLASAIAFLVGYLLRGLVA